MVTLSLGISVFICIVDFRGIEGCWQVHSTACCRQHWAQEQSSASVSHLGLHWMNAQRVYHTTTDALYSVFQALCQDVGSTKVHRQETGHSTWSQTTPRHPALRPRQQSGGPWPPGWQAVSFLGSSGCEMATIPVLQRRQTCQTPFCQRLLRAARKGYFLSAYSWFPSKDAV